MLDIAKTAVRLALEQGATGAECTIAEGDEFSANVRMREIETLKEAGSRAAGLRVLVGKRVGSSYTSDLSAEGIQLMVKSALEIAKISTEDPQAGLPEAEERRQIAAAVDLLAAYGPRAADAQIEVDLSLARGLRYYTGLVFEIYVDSDAGPLQVCGGGRYDGLAGLIVHDEYMLGIVEANAADLSRKAERGLERLAHQPEARVGNGRRARVGHQRDSRAAAHPLDQLGCAAFLVMLEVAERGRADRMGRWQRCDSPRVLARDQIYLRQDGERTRAQVGDVADRHRDDIEHSRHARMLFLDIFPEGHCVALARGDDGQVHKAEQPQQQNRLERRTVDETRDSRKHAEEQGEHYGRHSILLRSVGDAPPACGG